MAMHKPKKQRRFQDGGDVEEDRMKQRGLDISNRAREEGTEKTSFFQRLREGNIDDPNSAAYKKYGAGRARLDDQIEAGKSKLAEEVTDLTAKTPAAAVQSSKASKASKASDGDVSAYDLRTETAANAPKTNQSAAKPKSGIVTKKQLEESGLSLRDYMNKQQGKTRRGGKAPEQKTPEQKTPASQKPDAAYMRILMREDMEKAREEIQPQRREEQKVSQRRKSLADSVAGVGKGFSAVPGGVGGVGNLVKRTKADKDKYTRPAEVGMKKGGRVTASSASKRADGIAQRGKTRGRMY